MTVSSVHSAQGRATVTGPSPDGPLPATPVKSEPAPGVAKTEEKVVKSEEEWLQTLGPERFEAAKAQFLQQVGSGSELSAEAQILAKRRSIVGDDPLPNGLARNRKSLEAIIRFAHEQKILPRAAQIASAIGLIYFALTVLCAALYYAAGMAPFEAA